jgi:hypothetical protein
MLDASTPGFDPIVACGTGCDQFPAFGASSGTT